MTSTKLIATIENSISYTGVFFLNQEGSQYSSTMGGSLLECVWLNATCKLGSEHHDLSYWVYSQK